MVVPRTPGGRRVSRDDKPGELRFPVSWLIQQRTQADRDYLAEFEWTPELLDQYCELAQAMLAHLDGNDHDPFVDAGYCDDCGIASRRRQQVGRYACCRKCRRLRRNAWRATL